MDEFQLIKRYFSNSSCTANSQRESSVGNLQSDIDTGIGDDCAVLNVAQEKQLVVSIDTLVEGAHFFSFSEASAIAERAVAVSVSDLAAMGAQPKWLTLALTLPDYNKDWLSSFSKGLHRAIKYYDMYLIGGDTTRGPLTITMQVHGVVDRGQAVKRSGASAGDDIFVTGPLGDGAAALAMLKSELDVDSSGKEYLSDRFYRPRAKISAGIALTNLASAAIDVSDGLVADLGHVCRASNVGAIVDEKLLPFSDVLTRCASLAQRESWALSGGDDYQLCFTVPSSRQADLHKVFDEQRLECYKIGQVVSGSGVASAQTLAQFDFHAGGYSHF